MGCDVILSDLFPDNLFRLASSPPSVCNAVHAAPADRDGTASVTREGPFSLCGAADPAEVGGAGHQHTAAGYSASSGHPVATACLH